MPRGRGVPSLGGALVPFRAFHNTMRRNAMLTVFAAVGFVAGLLLTPPAFAHRARPAAAGPRVRYQAPARMRTSPTSHGVHSGGKLRARSAKAESRPAVSRDRRRHAPAPERAGRADHAHSGLLRAKGRSSRQVRALTTGREVSDRRASPAMRSHELTGPAPSPVASQTAAAVPVPVVSVIRQDAVHPQLEGVEEAAARTEILPDLYDERGKLNMIPALKGSHEILLRQNQMADLDGLTRIVDDDDLARLRETKALVPIPVNTGLRVDERLEWNRRFCRPWVAQFLVALGEAHYGEFHRPLQTNSAVRTVSFQLRLMRHNGNAAQAEGDAASPHLTGQAIDLAKKGLSPAEVAWMRLYLSRLVEAGRIDVEEEFRQACFHISVYKKYAPPVPQQRIATTHRTLTPALAEALE